MARMDYTGFQNLATTLIDDFGGDVTIETPSGGEPVFNETTLQYEQPSGTTTVVRAVLDDYNRQEGLIDDSAVTSDTQKVLIAGSIEAEVSDNIVIDSKTYQIKYKTVVRPNVADKILTILVVGA